MQHFIPGVRVIILNFNKLKFTVESHIIYVIITCMYNVIFRLSSVRQQNLTKKIRLL